MLNLCFNIYCVLNNIVFAFYLGAKGVIMPLSPILIRHDRGICAYPLPLSLGMPSVVYFDQCLDAVHSKHWSKYTTAQW